MLETLVAIILLPFAIGAALFTGAMVGGIIKGLFGLE